METATLENPSTELIKVEEAGTMIISSLNEALPYSQKFHSLAINAFKPVLDTIEAEGMNTDLDQQLNDLIVRANTAIDKMKAKRSPGTQMMSKIAKIFTTLENEVEAQKVIAQGYRNGWAKKCADEKKAKEQMILKNQAITKESIEIKSSVERQIREAFQNKIFEFKTFYTEKLNNATLQTLGEVTKTLNGIKSTYPHDKYVLLPVNVTAVYHDKAALAPMIFDVRTTLYEELSASFKSQMEEHQRALIDQIPSKKAELERIEKAGAEQKALLEEQAKQRQLAEQKRLQDESTAAKAKAEQNVQMQQQIATSTTLFDTAAELSEVNDNAAKVSQGFKVEVSSPAGWGAIFLFWFEKEGQKMDAAAMGKKSLDQMKTFCEKHAHKTSEKIDHVHVVYEEEYKAVATKAA